MAIKFLSAIDHGNYQLTAVDGSAGQVLTTDGNGNVTFQSVTASSNFYLNGVSFNTGSGVLTLSVAGASNQAVDLDGRYALLGHVHDYDKYSSWTLKTNSVQRTTVQSGGTLDLVAGSNVALSYSAGGKVTISSTDTNTDTNNYATGVSFDTATGLLAISRLGLSDISIDLDGRYTDNGYADALNQHLRITDSPTFRNLTLGGTANPRLDFNGSSDTGIDISIIATPEGLDFIEPEQSNKIHFQILDDLGVNSPYGYSWNGQSLDSRYARASHEHPISEVAGLQEQLDGLQPAGSYLTNETLTKLSISGNVLTYQDEAGVKKDIDLSLYLDDSNLARLTSGTLNGSTGVATFTRSDSSTFTVDFSAFLADANNYADGLSFSTSTGVLTLGRNGSLANLTVDLDGRYLTSLPSHNHNSLYDTLGSANEVNKRIDEEVLPAIGNKLDTSVNPIKAATVSNDTITFTRADNTTFNVTTSDSNTWRGIHDTPVDGATTTSISSNWAFDNVKKAVPSNAVFTDTNTQLTDAQVRSKFSAGSNISISSSGVISSTDTNTDTNNYLSSASFNTTNGVLTLNRSGLGAVTVDLDGRYAYSSHNHTSLTGVTSIAFAAQSSDKASISTTISSTSTFFDFNLADDNNNDWWRWRFTPSGSTVYDAMTLKPATNGKANLNVSGTIYANGGNSGQWNQAVTWGNHASAGYTSNVGTLTGISTGTGLDGTWSSGSGTITLDLSELADKTDAIDASVDEIIMLDNGAERRKRFAEIFGSAAYQNTSAFDAAGSADAVSRRIDEEVFPAIPTNNNQLTNGAGYITRVSDDRNTRGVTRLYGRDRTDAYNIQHLWTGSHWHLRGYNADTYHGEVRVGYADSAGSANSVAWGNVSGKPTIPTNNNQLSNGAGYQTNEQVVAEINKIVDGAPAALNTLNELAAAIGDNASYAASITTALAGKQAAGNYFTDGDTVINMANNDGFVYNDSTNRMYVKLDGTDREIFHTGNFNPANYQAAGTYNTIIGTDSDINTSGATIIDNIYVTDGVITSMGTRALTLANLGYTGATNANYITNNNQLTNGAGYLTSTNDRVYITDSRGSARAPSYYNDRYAQWDFQNVEDTGAGGDGWHALLTVSKWSSFDISHRQEQLIFTGDNLTRRAAISDSEWGEVKTIWDTGNLNPIVSAKVSNDTTTFTKADGSTFALTTSDANSNTYLTGAAFNTGNGVLTLTRNSGSVTVDLDGRYLQSLPAHNHDGVYLPIAGKAADSNLLDGLDLSKGRNNVANQVVRTNSSGYADFGWINTTSGNTTSALTDIYVNTNDGYIRKATPAHFRSQITNGHYDNAGSAAAVDARINEEVLPAIDGKANTSHTHSQYLLTTGKAADANLLDGINSSSFLRSDATDYYTNTLYGRGDLISGENGYRNRGMFGVYDSTKTAPIWSMGTAYRNNADGTNFGNLYGLAYKHTNNTTGGTMAGGHQMVWCTNGTPKSAMGDNIWTGGVVYASGGNSSNWNTAYGWGNHASAGYIKSYVNTTYSADGNYGITLSGTTFRLEDDRRRNNTGVDIYSGNTHDFTWYDASVGIRWYTAGSEDMRLLDNGTLHVDGDVIAYSTTISDKRLKDDVVTITNAIDKIKALRGVEYTWNAGTRKDKRDLGLIAQEVEEVLPEIVHDHEMPLMEDAEKDTVYKTVDYEKIVGVLIEGMKEQQAEIDLLKAEVKMLKQK